MGESKGGGMPFYYDLKSPDLGPGCILEKQLIQKRTFIEPNTAVALVTIGEKKVILRAVGRGLLAAWHVKAGEPVSMGQTFARMNADGEDIPYGRPYVVAETATTE